MDVVIIGAGGHGRVVLEILRLAREHQAVAFLDADEAKAGSEVDGLKVLGSVHMLGKLARQNIRGAMVAIGDNRIRRSYAQLVLQNGLELVNAIHPRAVVSPTAHLGRNVLVAAGAVAGTASQVGDSSILNTASVIDHECDLGVGVHICPGAMLGGRVFVEDGAFVGMGSRILPCLRIGAEAVVGAGAVVLGDVAAGCTVVGVPGRVVKGRQAIQH